MIQINIKFVPSFNSQKGWYCDNAAAPGETILYLWDDGVWRTTALSSNVQGRYAWYASKKEIHDVLNHTYGNEWIDLNADPLEDLAKLVMECNE